MFYSKPPLTSYNRPAIILVLGQLIAITIAHGDKDKYEIE